MNITTTTVKDGTTAVVFFLQLPCRVAEDIARKFDDGSFSVQFKLDALAAEAAVNTFSLLYLESSKPQKYIGAYYTMILRHNCTRCSELCSLSLKISSSNRPGIVFQSPGESGFLPRKHLACEQDKDVFPSAISRLLSAAFYVRET